MTASDEGLSFPIDRSANVPAYDTLLVSGGATCKFVLTIVVTILILGVAGCRTAPTAEPWQATVAKSYVRERFGTKKLEVGPMKAFEGYTSVWLWQLPKAPGGFVIIDVSNSGDVIGWHPGR